MSNEKITVNVQSGAGEILRIVSTVLLFSGIATIAWSVAQGQHAEVAASGMTLFIVMMIRLLIGRGMIQMPASTANGDDFSATKSLAAQVSGEYRKWLAGTSMPALVLIAAAYALALLALRAGVSTAFNVFSNLYIAGGVGAVVGAIVVFPSLLPNMINGLKRKGVVNEQPQQAIYVQAPPARAPTPSPGPAAVPPMAPATASTPVQPRSVPAPAPTAAQPQAAAAPAPKKVVRKVVKKKESTDV